MLVELIDGGVKNITTDIDYVSGGCPTCDYGTSWVNEYTIFMTNGVIKIEVDNDDNYTFSEGLMMKIFLQNIDEIKQMTEDSFSEWLKNKINNEIDAAERDSASYADINLTYSFKKDGEQY